MNKTGASKTPGSRADCQKAIVFIHINKTAGSSISFALKLPIEHKTALQKRDQIGISAWQRSFKFAFVRNPWDKVVSHYFYRVQTNQNAMNDRHISFRDWVRAAYGDKDPRYFDKPMMFMPHSNWICDDSGVPLVDFVGRFEALQVDFQRLCGHPAINSLAPALLPHRKRSDHGPFRGYYDQETMKIVENHFAADLVRFKYRW